VKLSDIRVDVAAIEAGDWVEDLPFEGLDGVRLNVRGTGNADYKRLHSKLFRDAGTRRFDADKVAVELLHRTVLLGWDGIFEEDEKTPLAFNSELALKLLSDPSLPAFRAAVSYAGNLVASRRKEPAEQAEKN
jgi:hypothetical protein